MVCSRASSLNLETTLMLQDVLYFFLQVYKLGAILCSGSSGLRDSRINYWQERQSIPLPIITASLPLYFTCIFDGC